MRWKYLTLILIFKMTCTCYSQNNYQFHFGSNQDDPFDQSLYHNDSIDIGTYESSLPRTEVAFYIEKKLTSRTNMRAGIRFRSFGAGISLAKFADDQGTWDNESSYWVNTGLKEVASLFDFQVFASRGIYGIGGLELGFKLGKTHVGKWNGGDVWFSDEEVDDFLQNEYIIRRISLRTRLGFGVKLFKRVGLEATYSRSLMDALKGPLKYGTESINNPYLYRSISGSLVYYFHIGKDE